jgi:hypothetical protein
MRYVAVQLAATAYLAFNYSPDAMMLVQPKGRSIPIRT